MNSAELAIQKKTVTLVLCLVTIGGGILAYKNLGRLEDPEFTIKSAVVTTAYPGATPMEVAQEAQTTDPVDRDRPSATHFRLARACGQPVKQTLGPPVGGPVHCPRRWDRGHRPTLPLPTAAP